LATQNEKKIRLLIVDDENEFRGALGQRLEMRDFQVTTAESAEDALAWCCVEKFDLALVDLKMPGMDGQELLQKLKKENHYLEVIILTGHGSMVSAVECTKLGAFNYLPKPYEMDELMVVLKDAYTQRLGNKFKDDTARTEELMRIAQHESPLGILRRMSALDGEHD